MKVLGVVLTGCAVAGWAMAAEAGWPEGLPFQPVDVYTSKTEGYSQITFVPVPIDWLEAPVPPRPTE